jgi:putative hydrolase of the HAD superfamily
MTIPVKAILFDADGVIVSPMMQFARHLAEVYGITPDTTRNFFHNVFDECLLGRSRLEEVLPPFLIEWGWPDSLEAFIAAWLREDHHVDARLADAIRACRRSGALCGLATLQEHHRAEYMRREMGFEQLFDRLFFSCELGCLKPDPKFYQRIERDLGLPGRAILFWDDLAWNVAAARDLGWNAEVYTGFEGFQEKMANYSFR